MTPRDFFMVVIRILGIFLLGSFLYDIPALVMPFFMSGIGSVAAISLVVVMIEAFLIWSMLMRTTWYVDGLGLAKGYSSEVFPLTWSVERIMMTALIVTSGILLFREIPNLLKYVFDYVEVKQLSHGTIKSDLSSIVKSTARVILALLLFGERERIVKLLVKNRTDA